jgi:hypothetical protein
MKFYAIPPNKHLDMMDNGDRYFGLAHHYVQDEKYRRHFLKLRNQSPKVFITMDCSAAEHSLVTEEVLLDITAELKPDEVIAPDVLFDKEQTLKNFKSFVAKMYNKGLLSHTSIFACPQGSNKDEWLECYYNMITSPFVKCIGLSKIAVPKCWNNAEWDTMIGISRNQCVKELSEKNWLVKPLHLLGMGEHDEFDFYLKNRIPFIRSSDSCYTILAALNGIDFEKGDTTRVPTTNAYFDVTLTEDQKALAKRNIEYLKNKYKNI